MNSVTFHPSEAFGSFLSGRDQGASMRAQIENLRFAADVVCVDLDGVEMMTPSFADEAFGRIAGALQDESVELRNVPSAIEALVSGVVTRRAATL